MTFSWTDQASLTLRLLAAKGATASHIGSILGTTRNAVIGKAHRMGVQIGANRVPTWISPKPKVAKRPKPAKLVVPAAKPEPAPVVVPKILAPVPRAPAAGKPVHFMDAGPRDCRFPLWPNSRGVPFADKFVCGAAATHGSHCDHHHRIVFTPRQSEKASQTERKEAA